MRYLQAPLLYDAEFEMRDSRGLDDIKAFEFNRRIQLIERAHAVAEQHRGQLDVDLVKQARFQALLNDRRADDDMLVTRRALGLIALATPSLTKVNGEPVLTHSCGG